MFTNQPFTSFAIRRFKKFLFFNSFELRFRRKQATFLLASALSLSLCIVNISNPYEHMIPVNDFQSCRKRETKTLKYFDAYISQFRGKKDSSIYSESIKQEISWDTITGNRIYSVENDEGIDIKSQGDLLDIDMRALMEIAINLQYTPSRFFSHHFQEKSRRVLLFYAHRRLHRLRGLQYVLHYEVHGKLNRVGSYLMQVSLPIGSKACDVTFATENETQSSIYMIVPYSGRPSRLRSTVKHFIQSRKSLREDVILIVSVLRDSEDVIIFNEIMNEFSTSSESEFVQHIWLSQNDGDSSKSFSRSVALREAAQLVTKQESVLFFCDIDIHVAPSFFKRCSHNTIVGYQAFFPIFYNKFSHANISEKIHAQEGFWRIHSYGMACITKKDFDDVKPFADAENRFHGWGPEDVFFYQKIKNHSSLYPFRAIEPSLIHTWHSKECDRASFSYQSCLNSNAMSIGHPRILAKEIIKNVPDVSLDTLSRYIKQS